jgi:hypothetical protein
MACRHADRRATGDVGQTAGHGWPVLPDPEGVEFCLLRARLES